MSLFIFFCVSSESDQSDSPRYANHSFSLSNANNITSNSTTEAVNSCHVNLIAFEQIQRDLLILKSTMDETKSKFSGQLQDLIHELDEEKKARATLQIEMKRVQKLFHKSSRINS